jgi:hypothetical protein
VHRVPANTTLTMAQLHDQIRQRIHARKRAYRGQDVHESPELPLRRRSNPPTAVPYQHRRCDGRVSRQRATTRWTWMTQTSASRAVWSRPTCAPPNMEAGRPESGPRLPPRPGAPVSRYRQSLAQTVYILLGIVKAQYLYLQSPGSSHWSAGQCPHRLDYSTSAKPYCAMPAATCFASMMPRAGGTCCAAR